MSLAYSPTRGSRWSFMISSHRGLRAGARRIWARTSSPTVRLGWWVMATMWWLVPPPGSHVATRTPRPTSPTTSTMLSTSTRPRVRQGNQLRHPKRRPPVKEFRKGHLLKTQPPAVEVCNWRGHLLKITQMGSYVYLVKVNSWIYDKGCFQWRAVDSHLIRTFQKISKSISILTPVLHYFSESQWRKLIWCIWNSMWSWRSCPWFFFFTKKNLVKICTNMATCIIAS